ncbi:MAG UNVERIFIED_CONTAM: hypothetical protein LVR29_06160 [Microcystis novacekii LVE1205-3]|jgi:hypothetical protein
MIIGTRTDHPLSFATKRATHMTILSNGNVGIGTTNPQAKLDVNGNLLVTSGSVSFGKPKRSTD